MSKPLQPASGGWFRLLRETVPAARSLRAEVEGEGWAERQVLGQRTKESRITGVAMCRQYRTALAWQIGLAGYMQLISWVPLGRWNYQPCCPTGLELLRRGALSPSDVLGTGAFLLPVALFWLGARREWRWAMWLALVATAVWLGLQLWTWWPPYLFGASDHWAQVYARAFAHSTPILPRWGTHLPPDAMHLVLQVLLLGSVASGTMALLRQRL